MVVPAGSGNQPEIIYGLQAVREALRAASRPLLRVIVTHDDRRLGDLLRLARQAQVPVHMEPRVALDRLVPSGKHQGVVALVAAKAYADLEQVVATASAAGHAALLVVLDGIEDPRNLGAVLRTADAAGAHGAIVPERRAVGLTPAVAKASAGALEHILVSRVGNLNRALESLKEAGIWLFGFDPDAETLYTKLDYRQAVALVFGGEGRGMRPSVREKCDAVGRLPMQGRVASLNVSAAAAAVLFEAVRQRNAAGVAGSISGAG